MLAAQLFPHVFGAAPESALPAGHVVQPDVPAALQVAHAALHAVHTRSADVDGAVI